MNYGSVLDANYAQFSDDEKLNYGLKIALSRLQTELNRAWYQEPKDFAPKGPESIYKNKLPSYADITGYYLIDPFCTVNGSANTSVITDVTVGDILNNSNNASGWGFGDTNGSKDFYDVQTRGNKSVRNNSTNITNTSIAQQGLSYRMFTRYRYWENGLTGKNSNTDGTAGSSSGGTNTNKTEPENAILSYVGNKLSSTRTWKAYDDNLGKGNSEDQFFTKLTTYSSPIKIIHPDNINTNDYTDITKAHPFLEIYIQVPTVSTRQGADTANTSGSGNNANGTDNIGFFNPILRQSLGDVEGYKYVIRGWAGSTAKWGDLTIETGATNNTNILYFLNNPGFILCYGVKDIVNGLNLSYKYPPLISFLRYTGETFSDGIISQGDTLPSPDVSNDKDLFINTSDNTIHRLEDDNGTKTWVGIGGGGGAGGELLSVSKSILVSGQQNVISCGNLTRWSGHVLVILKTGRVMSCGDNNDSQLGFTPVIDYPSSPYNKIYNTVEKKLISMDIPDGSSYTGSNAIAVGAGDRYSVVLLNTGEVMACGWNYYGQLGDGTGSQRSTLVSMDGIPPYDKTNAVAISVGDYHTVVLLNTGEVMACGHNDYGQLGDGTSGEGTNKNQLVSMIIPSGSSYTGSNAVAISAGSNTTAILLNTGEVMICGRNNYGQLGIGSNGDGTNSSKLVSMHSSGNYDKTNAVAISCGGNHTAVLLNTGQVMVCGHNEYGQLGIGNTNNQNTLVSMDFSDLDDKTYAIVISCSGVHTAILLNTGEVMTCGHNKYGQLGVEPAGSLYGNPRIQKKLDSMDAFGNYDKTNAVTISCSEHNTVVLLNTGEVMICGMEERGILGIGTNPDGSKAYRSKLVSMHDNDQYEKNILIMTDTYPAFYSIDIPFTSLSCYDITTRSNVEITGDLNVTGTVTANGELLTGGGGGGDGNMEINGVLKIKNDSTDSPENSFSIVNANDEYRFLTTLVDGSSQLYMSDALGNYTVNLTTNFHSYFNVSGGNVGIGTDNPDGAKLTIGDFNNVASKTTGGIYDTLRLCVSTTQASSYHGLHWYDINNNFIMSAIRSSVGSVYNNCSLHFYTSKDRTPTEKMSIDGDGNVNISQGNLTVSETITGKTLKISNPAQTTHITNIGGDLYLGGNNTFQLRLSSTGSNLYSGLVLSGRIQANDGGVIGGNLKVTGHVGIGTERPSDSRYAANFTSMNSGGSIIKVHYVGDGKGIELGAWSTESTILSNKRLKIGGNSGYQMDLYTSGATITGDLDVTGTVTANGELLSGGGGGLTAKIDESVKIGRNISMNPPSSSSSFAAYFSNGINKDCYLGIYYKNDGSSQYEEYLLLSASGAGGRCTYYNKPLKIGGNSDEQMTLSSDGVQIGEPNHPYNLDVIGNLDVTETITGKTLKISGTGTNITNIGSSLRLGGNNTYQMVLSSTGSNIYSSLVLSKHLQVNSYLIVLGDVTADGKLTAKGDGQINGNLNVTGTVTANGELLTGGGGGNNITGNMVVEGSGHQEPLATFKSSGDCSVRIEGTGGEVYLEIANKASSGNSSKSWGIGTNDDNKLHLAYGDNGKMNKDDAMVITSSRYVGIGTDNPEAGLHVKRYKSNSGNVRSLWTADANYTLYAAWQPSLPGGNNTGKMVIGSWTSHIGIKVDDGYIWTTYGMMVTSDERIKKDIIEINDNTSLKKVRGIKCYSYSYKNPLRFQDTNIGFLAQQVREHVPHAVSIKKEIIPDVLKKITDAEWESIIDVSGVDVSNNNYKLFSSCFVDVSGVKYRFYVTNDISGNEDVEKDIIGNADNSFTFDQIYKYVFCYGKEVDDFHTLDKQKLFALNFSATQEIDRIQQQQLLDISGNKVEIELLKLENAQLKQQNQTLIERLEAIEKRLQDANI